MCYHQHLKAISAHGEKTRRFAFSKKLTSPQHFASSSSKLSSLFQVGEQTMYIDISKDNHGFH